MADLNLCAPPCVCGFPHCRNYRPAAKPWWRRLLRRH
jgi:hypothetical protein